MILVIIIFGFIIGPVLGSFSKAMADRSLTKRSFLGRSHCDKCKTPLNVFDLFPIFSYLLLRGKCRYCHKKYGADYLLVEGIMGIVIALLFFLLWYQYQDFQFDFSNISGYYSLFVLVSDISFKLFSLTILAIVFLTDIKKMLIPDRVILPAIVISFIWLLTDNLIKVGYLYYFLSQTQLGKFLLPPHSDYFYRHALDALMPLIGGLFSGLGIGGFFLALIIITRGKGMGGGDVKLGAFMGLVLGFPNAILAIISSFVTGAIFSIGLVLLGKKHFGQAIPFGPFLVLGSLIAMFRGEEIINWYLSLSF